MRRKRSFIILLSFAVLTGCSQNSGEADSLSSISSQQSIETDEAVTATGKTIEKTEISTEMLHGLEGVEGNIRDIICAADNNFLIIADQLYLYNIAEKKTVAEQKIPDLQDTKVFAIDNGFAVSGRKTTKDSESMPYYCYFYNEDLEIEEEYNLNDLLSLGEEGFITAFALTDDGEKAVAYDNPKALYSYDFKTKKGKMILDLDADKQEENKGLCAIENMTFTNDNKDIAFYGESFDVPITEGSDSFWSYGSIHMDGTGLFHEKTGRFLPAMLYGFQENVILGEDLVASMTYGEATGEAWKYDTSSNQVEKYKLEEKAESQAVFCSDTGKYFATIVDQDTTWKVRLYETETGKKITEWEISNENEKVDSNFVPVIRLNDEQESYMFFSKARDEKETDKIQIGQIPLP